MWTFPVFRLMIHITLYHLVPMRFYQNRTWGNRLYYAAELTNYMAAVMFLVSLLVVWIAYVPDSFVGDKANTYPLMYITPFLIVLIMWMSVFGFKRYLVSSSMESFNQQTFLERVRESVFREFIIEVMREAKRKHKRRISSMMGDGTLPAPTAALSKELQMRMRYLVVPDSLLKSRPEYMTQVEKPGVSAHSWKRILDHFYAIVLQDDHIRGYLEDETHAFQDETLRQHLTLSREAALKVKKNPIVVHTIRSHATLLEDEYHHLHRFNHDRLQKQHKKSWTYDNNDDKAFKLASKLFKTLGKPDKNYLDVKSDILPIFSFCATFPDMSKDNGPSTNPEQWTRERNGVALIDFFNNLSASGRIHESDLKLFLQRCFRERRRVVASLSGMTSVVERVNDFFSVAISALLILSTLSIFGINAVGTLVSLSSVLVSFAFLFGSSAKWVLLNYF